jgi:death-on-curing protein
VTAEPVWLDFKAVLAMHGQLIAGFGGTGAVRDPGLLDTALARARHRFAYGETDLFTLAATYGHGIVRNHPFVDGNKRTAFIAVCTFLHWNGWAMNAPEAEAATIVDGLAARSVSEAEFAEWLRRSCVRVSPEGETPRKYTERPKQKRPRRRK